MSVQNSPDNDVLGDVRGKFLGSSSSDLSAALVGGELGSGRGR